MKDFRKLKVWEKSHQLTLEIYRATDHFPKDELFGLISQLRRASVSVAANIAEGCGKKSDADFGRFLGIAMGSASELDYLILLATELDLFDISNTTKLASEIIEVKKMLATLKVKLKADR